jgi:hypothetical protein
MAESPSHRFGQVVGNLLEEILLPELLTFCRAGGLYLDRHGARVNVRRGKKLSWEDKYGNSHDLDFVIERGGTEDCRGRPVAFIEAAWRRYAKHSKAKAQEIQGAILPIAEKYELEAPFLGAVLAGIFTAPSLEQLRSLGFQLVYLPYESIVAAFASAGIDARFDETTSDEDFRACVDKIEAMPKLPRTRVKEAILASNRAAFEDFFTRLRRKLDRTTMRITVLPLFGTPSNFANLTDAVQFITTFDREAKSREFRKFEVIVVFSNLDEIKGIFSEEQEAIRFLRYVTS